MVTLTALMFLGSGFTIAQNAHEVLSGNIAPEVLAASEALGMVRGVGNSSLASVNFESYQGTGRIRQNDQWQPISTFRLEFDYTIPAARIDFTVNNNRVIQVVRDDRVWLESTPGVIQTIQDNGEVVEYRKRQIYATATGAIRAAVEAEIYGDGVQISTRDGKTVLEFAHHGIDFLVTLNNDNRPESVVIANSAGTFTAHFYDYRDYEGYFVYHPSRITHSSNGQVTLELNLDEVHMNPYVLIPTPEQLGY